MLLTDNDPFVCRWLGQLWPAAEVHHADIRALAAADIVRHDWIHLFAGIGGWQLALEWAGVSGGRILTGSCPCQPFSSNGKRQGVSDERHLWPEMRRCIAVHEPAIVFGEQVAGGLGLEWLARVQSELEDDGFAVAAADLCAAGIGAPHQRQRIYWGAVWVGNPSRLMPSRPRPCGGTDGMAASAWAGQGRLPGGADVWGQSIRADMDGTLRRVAPEIPLLVDGLSTKMGNNRIVAPALKGFGNAIVPVLAARFVAHFVEACHDKL